MLTQALFTALFALGLASCGPSDAKPIPPAPSATDTATATATESLATILGFSDACGENLEGTCTWVSVKSPDGQAGWAFHDYLRWDGIPPPSEP